MRFTHFDAKARVAVSSLASLVGVACSSGDNAARTPARDSGATTPDAVPDGGSARDASLTADGQTGGDGASAAASPKHLEGLATGDWIESLAFSGDGSVLWAAAEAQIGGATGETSSWDVGTSARVVSVNGPAWSVALAPTGSNVAVGGPAVDVLSPQGTSAATVMTLAGASGAVAYSHNGKWIAAAAPDTNQVIIYSVLDGSVVAKVAHPVDPEERIWRVTFSFDDRWLATGSGQSGLGSPHGSTFVWQTSDWTQLSQLNCSTFDAVFSNDGATLALACWLNFKVVATKDWSVTRTTVLPGMNEALGVAFSPDSSKLAVGGFEQGVQIYQTADGTSLEALTDGAKAPTVKALVWRPDGTMIAGGGWDDAIVRLWSVNR